MNNYGTHFPNNRDGGVSGPGRTKARFLQSELPGLPFASARRKSADGMTDITARKRGDGFTEVRLQQQEAEWTQDAWVVNTRDWFDKDMLRTHSRLKSRKPKPGSSETPMWRAWQDLPQPLGLLDPAAAVQRGGVFSMGGNGRVFVSAPVAKSYVYDAWEWRFLNLGGVYNLAHARAKAREQAALAPPGYHGTACVERAHGIWVGAPGGAMRKVGQVQVASFSAFDADGGQNGYRGLGLPTLFEGMRFQNELVGTVAFVDGARWRGRYESAVAYSAINEQGWHVARVRVFDANGWHIEADVAADADSSWTVAGFWRLGPGRLMLHVAGVYPVGIELQQQAGWPPAGPDKDNRWRFSGHRGPSVKNPAHWLALSDDGGRSWRRAPENALLAPINDLMRRVAAGEVVADWRTLHHYSFSMSVAPVSRSSCFVVASRTEVAPGGFLGTDTSRCVLNAATGGVSNLAQVWPAEAHQARNLWRMAAAFNLPPKQPGRPLGVGMVTSSRLWASNYNDYLNDPCDVWVSADGAASFQRVGSLPSRLWSCSTPRALTADAVHVVDVSARPPLMVNALIKDGPHWRWQQTAANLGVFRMYIQQAPVYYPNALDAYVEANGVNPGAYVPVHANGNPTPHAPWLSDDRKEAP